MPRKRHSNPSRRTIILFPTLGVAHVPLSQGQFAIIDIEDAERIGKWNWSAAWKDGTKSYYACRGIKGDNGRQGRMQMHAEVMNVPIGALVDHVESGNTLDNRRCNLRLATQSQNMANTRLNARNTSGCKGVSWREDSRKWRARIQYMGKMTSLGNFDDLSDAKTAYDKVAIETFGDFARL